MTTKQQQQTGRKGLTIHLSAFPTPSRRQGLLSAAQPMKTFIVSREARDRYQFDQALFQKKGTVLFPDFQAVRRFAEGLKEDGARAGEINAMGLIHEIFHHVISLYIEIANPNVMEEAFARLEKTLGKEALDHTLEKFARQFPPQSVYQGNESASAYLHAHSDGVPHRHVLLEEMVLLWIASVNPAQAPYKKNLFDDTTLRQDTDYLKVIDQLEIFFQTQPFFGPGKKNLPALLRSPAVAAPDSLPEQLKYIRDHWGLLLEDYFSLLLEGLDLVLEDEKFGGHGPGQTPVYDFSDAALTHDYERFTTDQHWMPRMVLIAKSTYVWLNQLSKKYKTHICRLDQIPDEELAMLADQGFTGLWLIGVWERGLASAKIKKICGNPEAMSSAYSISDYQVSLNLGGDDALQNLKYRANRKGIRLAGDMVPNHMGLDSPWLAEHPDWFLWLKDCPYPSYTFNGPDLAGDPRVEIYLEDHYYDRTDAAVVFKWVSRESGEVRYIYHGNDGTSMPWNDTAQLNYMNPELREKVINTIFDVSRQFPVIRFDAAMTLTRKHYQRLWFPEPGSGGDIPTRAGKGMSRTEFLKHMPEEFWRNTVDRFAASHSDTLLLAEAFWMMEAYFVRTLGMHRVYNSAFMNFLKNEDNAQFRTSIKNVLTFNPEILKRFVNFLNNPDEETAVTQFGKDDKYFGVTALMATLPGLPMFGHGQIEGFSEKYGMEYFRAYKDETPDAYLLERHNREIFPLLKQRHLFADVVNFLFYDLYTGAGHVNEDVIAYSNNQDGRASLVVFHNRFAETSGWIRMSLPYSKSGGDEVVQRSLAQGLDLSNGDADYVVYRDVCSGLQYIRPCRELHEKGFFVVLNAYKKHVFLDFEVKEDGAEGLYAAICDTLGGNGVPDMEREIRRLFKNPLKQPFEETLALLETAAQATPASEATPDKGYSANLLQALTTLLTRVNGLHGAEQALPAEQVTKAALQTALQMQMLSGSPLLLNNDDLRPMIRFVLIFALLQTLTDLRLDTGDGATAAFLEEWLLTESMETFMKQSQATVDWEYQQEFLRTALDGGHWRKPLQLSDRFFNNPSVRKQLGVNHHQGVTWYNKEAAENFIQYTALLAALFGGTASTTADTGALHLKSYEHIHSKLRRMMEKSEYRLDKLASQYFPVT